MGCGGRGGHTESEFRGGADVVENRCIVRRPSYQEEDGQSQIFTPLSGLLFFDTVTLPSFSDLPQSSPLNGPEVVSVDYIYLYSLSHITYPFRFLIFNKIRCGWTTNSEDLDGFILKCEADNEYSRAAAVAIFCLQLNTALQVHYNRKIARMAISKYIGVKCLLLLVVQVLDRGAAAQAEQAASYHMVSISLSGFASGGDGLWKRMVRSHQGQIEDAYLRAAFLFLTADDAEEESYKAILALDGLELSDKV